MLSTHDDEFDLEGFLARTGSGRALLRYAPREIVFAQGDAADAVFYIKKGRVKIGVTSPDGREAVVALLKDHDFFGENCLAGQLRRMTAATAITDCEILRLEKAAITQVIHERPEFAERFIAHILARSIRTEEDLVDQLFNSSEKRLARALLLLANVGQDGKPEAIDLKINQETLAAMVGTTRSRISAFMNKFRKLGYIDYNGTIEVHSSLLNVLLYDRRQGGADGQE